MICPYSIAKDLEREGKFPGHVVYGTSRLLVRGANCIRRLADENESLKQQIKNLESQVYGGTTK